MKKTLLVFVTILLNLGFAISQDLNWANSINGGTNAYAFSVTTDAAGNVYTCGGFQGTTDFDPTAGVVNLTSATSGFLDAFVQKVDANGNFLWAKQIGGINDDRAYSIVVDNSGNLVICGQVTIGSGVQVDMDPGTAVVNTNGTGTGFTTPFVLKLTSDGDYIWHGCVYVNGPSLAYDIAVDNANNIYFVGSYKFTGDFDSGSATVNVPSGTNNQCAYVAKWNSNGVYQWAKIFPSTLNGTSHARKIKVDANNLIFITGQVLTTSPSTTIDLDPSSAINNYSVPDNESHGYVVVLNSNGDYQSGFGLNTGVGSGFGIVPDDQGNFYLSGWFTTMDADPSSGVSTLTSFGTGSDVFLAKYTQAGNLIWAKQFGGTGADIAYGVEKDSIGNIFVFGSFEGTGDFDPSSAAATSISTGLKDAFAVKLSKDGDYIWHVGFGGTGNDELRSIKCVDNKELIAAGTFQNTATISIGATSETLTAASGIQAYTLRLDYCFLPNTTVTQNSSTLNADESNATYQWIDCNNSNQPISGETNQSFTATVNGSYAVIVTQNGCSDTSSCMIVNDAGLGQLDDFSLKIFPNPTSSKINIHSEEVIESIQLMDINGRIVMTISPKSLQMELDLTHLNSGIYFAKIQTVTGKMSAQKISKN